MMLWDINLLGIEDASAGEVMTRDGEVIGTWSLDENYHPGFTPDGHTEQMFWDIGVPMLCAKIKKWHDAKSS
jgi:hypothetical protein